VAAAEVVAGPGDDDHLHAVVVLRPGQEMVQFCVDAAADDVPAFRPVDGDRHDLAVLFVGHVLALHG
jgi:hypothetical protein